jgi:hypothetical protein
MLNPSTDNEPPHVFDGVIKLADQSYMEDSKGSLVPLELVKPADKLMDETVRRIMVYARDLSAQIARFKGHTFEDVNAFQSLLEQDYGAKMGGSKGNLSLTSFDGRMKIQVQIADLIEFGPELQIAKTLIDECLIEWGQTSRPEIRALVDRVFSVGKEGQINRAELFGLLRLDIPDPRWLEAMRAIKDSIRRIGSKKYVRFYERSTLDAPWSAVSIDLATA